MTYAGFRFTGRFSTPTRPADRPPAVEGEAWARDKIAGVGGTEVDATMLNRLKANLENFVTRLGGDLNDGDEQLANAIAGALEGKAAADHNHDAAYYHRQEVDELIADASALLQAVSQKGQANGYAALDVDGKVPVGQLPAAVVGAVSYQGAWNAATNTPALASGVGTQGRYYVVTTAGSTALDGFDSWQVGDWAIYNGTVWQKVDNVDAVASVAGLMGAITASSLKAALNIRVSTIAALAALTPVSGEFAETLGYASSTDGGGGLWQFSSANLSAAVTADPLQGMYVAPASVPTGAGGAWVRSHEWGAVHVRWWGAKGDGVTDDRPPCQAAVNWLDARAGGEAIFTDGTYLLSGAVSPDTLKNGILIPYNGGITPYTKIALRGVGRPVLKAANDNMILVRACRAYTQITGFAFNGNLTGGRSNVWAIGLCGENRSSATPTAIGSHSFSTISNNYVHNCTEGIVNEPGPSVLAPLPYAGSGAFYCDIMRNVFDQCHRDIWLKVCPNDPLNRPTRTNICFNVFTRGNCAIDVDYATETLIEGNNWELFKSTYSATPRANACAIHIGAKTENTWLYGGVAEACDVCIWNEGTLVNAISVDRFPLGGVNIGMTIAPAINEHFIRSTRRSALYEPLRWEGHHAQFGRAVWDKNGDGTRDFSLYTNDVLRATWYNGDHVHYGSAGNVTLGNTGSAIQFSRGNANTISCTTSGGYLALSAFGGTPFVINATSISVGDNVMNCGTAGARVKEYFGVNAAINTSDSRLKTWRGALSEAELIVAQRIESELFGCYQWNDAIEEKGADGARWHFGVRAQDVKAIFTEEGCDWRRYAFLCFDEWADVEEPVLEMRQVAVLDAEGAPVINIETGEPLTEYRYVPTGGTQVVTPAGNRYGIRYEELSNFLRAAAMQTRAVERAALEAEREAWAAERAALSSRLDTFESRLAALEAA